MPAVRKKAPPLPAGHPAPIDALPPRRRAILLMYEVEGTPIPSIAKLLGISAVTVRWHLSIGRREMAKSLGKGSHD